MPLSETHVVNKALVMIGARPINSLGAASDTGLACRVLFEPERDAMLRRYRWNFSLKWVALQKLAPCPINLAITPNSHHPGDQSLTQAYAAPADFLRLSRWSPESSAWRLVNGDPYGFNGMVILTDAVPTATPGHLNGLQPPNGDGPYADLPRASNLTSPAVIGMEYVARVTDPNRWDSLFVDYLSTKLAMELAFALTGMESQQDRASQKWKEKELEAATVNGLEQWPDALVDEAVVDVRYGYSGAGIA